MQNSYACRVNNLPIMHEEHAHQGGAQKAVQQQHEAELQDWDSSCTVKEDNDFYLQLSW